MWTLFHSILVCALIASISQHTENYGHLYSLQLLEKNQKELISPGKAAEAAKKKVKGKVLNVKLTLEKMTPVYRVRILLDTGHVHHILVDGVTGRILRVPKK